MLSNLFNIWHGRISVAEAFIVTVLIGNAVWVLLWGGLITSSKPLYYWSTYQLTQGHDLLFLTVYMLQFAGLALYAPVSCLILWRAARRNGTRIQCLLCYTAIPIILLFSCLAWPYFCLELLRFSAGVGDTPFSTSDQTLWLEENHSELVRRGLIH